MRKTVREGKSEERRGRVKRWGRRKTERRMVNDKENAE